MRSILIAAALALQASAGAQPPVPAAGDSSRFFTDSLFSPSLNAVRRFCVYLPQGYDPSRTYPTIYATDGRIITREGYVRSLDSLIAARAISPMVLVGAWSDERPADAVRLERRNYEYVHSMRSATDSTLNGLYAKHLRFFTRELMPYCQRTYTGRTKAADRTFFGTSNGAAFGVTMALTYPDLFGNYILCSPAGIANSLERSFAEAPAFRYKFIVHVEAGTQETDRDLSTLLDFMDRKRIRHLTTRLEGGHDRKLWQVFFRNTLSVLHP